MTRGRAVIVRRIMATIVQATAVPEMVVRGMAARAMTGAAGIARTTDEVREWRQDASVPRNGLLAAYRSLNPETEKARRTNWSDGPCHGGRSKD